MAEQISIEVIGYNRSELNRTISTQFTQFGPTASAEPEPVVATAESIDSFFNSYESLFFNIPKFGETNSHEYLVRRSSEYIGGEAINEEVLALQNEITQLRQENLELQQSILNLRTPA